ncbi:MAG: hypothetical protein EBQ67_00865 [Sphingobacteriia bacterium]|nr:hypothetical protein [Sphingobacteriia bacterium]
MCHAPALRFGVQERGFLREGYAADLVLLAEKPIQVDVADLEYACGWSPVEGELFTHSVRGVWVNGQTAYLDNQWICQDAGRPLEFCR